MEGLVSCPNCNFLVPRQSIRCSACLWDLRKAGPVQRTWAGGSGTREGLISFLSEPVPAGGTAGWNEWQRRAKAFGQFAPPILMEVLEGGEEEQQYAALLSLRLYGFEVWGERRGDVIAYRLRRPGAGIFEVVAPLRPPRANIE